MLLSILFLSLSYIHSIPNWDLIGIIPGRQYFLSARRRLQSIYRQFRRFVRLATPATLTGVRGRPTSAFAGETKPSKPGMSNRSPTANALTAIAQADSVIFIRLELVILILPY
jgi:hypothetical protein